MRFTQAALILTAAAQLTSAARVPAQQVDAGAYAKRDLPKDAELAYLRAFATYAPAESQATSAQSELLAAQIRFEAARAKFNTARELFQSKSAALAKANGCTTIDVTGDHPQCVPAPPELKK